MVKNMQNPELSPAASPTVLCQDRAAGLILGAPLLLHATRSGTWSCWPFKGVFLDRPHTESLVWVHSAHLLVVKGDLLIFLWKLSMRCFNVTSPAKRGEQAGKARQGKPRMLEGT